MQSINRIGHRRIFPLYLVILLCTTLMPTHAPANDKLKVGIPDNTPPLSFVEPNSTVQRGFCVDLAKLLAAGMDLEAEIYPTKENGLIPALKSNEIDIAIGVLDNAHSTANVIKTSVFAERGYYINSRLLTTVPDENHIDCTVALEKGRTLSWLFPSGFDFNVIETNSQEESLTLVESGQAQIYISRDNALTFHMIKDLGLHNVKQAGIPFESAPLVIAVNKEDMELLTAISIAYGKILEDGSYHRIFYKWLGNDIWVIMSKYKAQIIGMTFLIALGALVFVSRNKKLQRKVRKISNDLQLSEQKYKDLIESSPDMVHLISSTGNIRLTNKIATTHLIYSKEELASLKLQDIVPFGKVPGMADFIDRVFEGRCLSREFTFISKDGKTIDVEMVASTVKWYNSSEPLACCFSRDLTERKRLEEELIRSDRLAIMGRMASGIAHEINNPLSIILSNVDDILNYELTRKDLHDSLKSIERNARRSAIIIEDLLAFTRPNQLRTAPIVLPDVIDNTMFYLKQRLQNKNITVEKNCPADLVFNGNENLIQQMLINILLNSIQAVNGDGTISVNARRNGGNIDREIILEIEDNGMGIEQENIEKIFDPFFTARKEDGFGLGLFLSKIIIEKHAGSITATSVPGKGTLMMVKIPG